jgi:maltose O-acetyltransferase
MKNIWNHLRYDWPIHFLLLVTNWLPDNVIFLRIRGFLIRPFFGTCGKDLRVGRNIVFYNPGLIKIGDHVYFAYGCFIMATDQINIGDEVLFGPYCVVASGNHTSFNGSYRYGPAQTAPITIGKGDWIGAHVTITAGCEIGENTLIAAGAVVTQNMPADVVAGGIPARVIDQVKEKKI